MERDPRTPHLCNTSRILMTTDPASETWIFTLELARAICAQGWEVCLATLGSMPSMLQKQAAEKIPGLRLFLTDYKLEWMEKHGDDARSASRWLLNLERQCVPDVVHLNSFSYVDLPWDAPVVLTAHRCVTSWWQATRGEDP